MTFNNHNLRLRRLRRNSAIRALVRDLSFGPNNLVLPLFVKEGIDDRVPIKSMPGVFQYPLSDLTGVVKNAIANEVRAFGVFGIPSSKGLDVALSEDNILCQAVKELKELYQNDIVIIPDLCLDEYLESGHCGVMDSSGEVDNDATVEHYAQMGLNLAAAGADFVAPSGMMDYQVAAIRSHLDSASFTETGILAYSAKFASSLYGPFRDAVNVDLRGGNRKTYQQSPYRRKEFLLEVAQDLEQGADIVMIKPAMFYLDVIKEVSQSIDVPVAAYQVSGEYSMIQRAGSVGMADLDSLIAESIYSIKRAGANIVFSYFASDFLRITEKMKNGIIG